MSETAKMVRRIGGAVSDAGNAMFIHAAMLQALHRTLPGGTPSPAGDELRQNALEVRRLADDLARVAKRLAAVGRLLESAEKGRRP